MAKFQLETEAQFLKFVAADVVDVVDVDAADVVDVVDAAEVLFGAAVDLAEDVAEVSDAAAEFCFGDEFAAAEVLVR